MRGGGASSSDGPRHRGAPARVDGRHSHHLPTTQHASLTCRYTGTAADRLHH